MPISPSVLIHLPERLSLSHDYAVPSPAGTDDDAFQAHVAALGRKCDPAVVACQWWRENVPDGGQKYIVHVSSFLLPILFFMARALRGAAGYAIGSSKAFQSDSSRLSSPEFGQGRSADRAKLR